MREFRNPNLARQSITKTPIKDIDNYDIKEENDKFLL